MRPSSSIPLENGLFLRDERLVGALEVAGLHADRLGLRLGLDRLVEAHRPFLVELRLGDAVREGRAGNDAPRYLHRVRLESIGLDETVVETPALALGGAHGAAGVEQFGGTSLAGGRFSLIGTLVGALLIQTLKTTINVIGIPSEMNYLFKAIVVIAVFVLQSPRARALLTVRRRGRLETKVAPA